MDEDFSLKEYSLKMFAIASCQTIIGQSLKDMKKETLNSCWKKLWPDCVNNYKGFSPEEVQQSAIIGLSSWCSSWKEMALKILTEDEISSLIDRHSARP